MTELAMLLILLLVVVNSKLWNNGYWKKYGKYGQWISKKL